MAWRIEQDYRLNVQGVVLLNCTPNSTSVSGNALEVADAYLTLTTSPSGRHLGHYKSLFTVIDRSLECDDRKELKEIQERIAGCYVAILNYAIRHNYSYKRWKQILNFMIYKEQGNVKINRLRVIHIYEADYNFLIGAVWREGTTTSPNWRHLGHYKSLFTVTDQKVVVCLIDMNHS